MNDGCCAFLGGLADVGWVICIGGAGVGGMTIGAGEPPPKLMLPSHL